MEGGCASVQWRRPAAPGVAFPYVPVRYLALRCGAGQERRTLCKKQPATRPPQASNCRTWRAPTGRVANRRRPNFSVASERLRSDWPRARGCPGPHVGRARVNGMPVFPPKPRAHGGPGRDAFAGNFVTDPSRSEGEFQGAAAASCVVTASSTRTTAPSFGIEAAWLETRFGSSTQNVDPRPRAESSEMMPPCARTICWQI